MNAWKMILIWISTLVFLITGVCFGVNGFDLTSKYINNVRNVRYYQNDIARAVPQTEVHNIILNHFNKINIGKNEKKCIVIGLSGCRADALSKIEEDFSGIKELNSEGGVTLLSYCGGVNYPDFNTQETTTGPGWASILTGEWADIHGVSSNNIQKSNDYLSLLTTLVQSKLIKSSVFYTSCPGNFTTENSTFSLEKQYCEQNGLNVSWLYNENDKTTLDSILGDLANPQCSDFIFSTLEYTNNAGHRSGYNIDNPDYVNAFHDADAAAKQIIDAIHSRANFGLEDWLIIITSDHGGYNLNDGHFTLPERLTFISSGQ